MRITILGSGASSGTPAVDWGWGKCDPNNPKNRRTRPSVLVEAGGTRILVDTAPDLREQLITAKVRTLSAVLFTHAHADHLHGIDDLRAINRATNAPLPAFTDAPTLESISQRFGYVFEALDEGARYYYKPVLEPHVIDDGSEFEVGGVPIRSFRQSHGFSETLGFRIGDIAYTTDCVELPDHAFEILAGVRVWVIGTLTDVPHTTHCDVSKALRWIDRIKPERAVLSHLGCNLDYDALANRLPDGVEPAYDGLMVATT